MQFQYVKDFMDRLTGWIIPGNAIVVYKDGEKVFSYASGYSDLENGVKMEGNELFNIYSCSKVTTVTAALQLYEKGYFLLDDPLYDIIPAYKDVKVKDKDESLRRPDRPITLRHLFTMTAGLTYNSATPAFEKARALTGGKMDTVKVAECLAEDPLTFDPGDHWNYSLCHDVLAAVVEVVSGERFADYVKNHIFDPLGMKDSSYHPTAEAEKRMAEQYIWDVNGATDLVALQREGRGEEGVLRNIGKKASYRFGENYDSGGAGITTSVDDYALLAAALAGYGKGINGERILAPGTVELLRTNQLTPAQAADFTWKQLTGYGYGLGVRTMIDPAKAGFPGFYSEFGWGGAAGATILVDPDENLGVFYAHHMLNPHEEYYQPRLRNVVYAGLSE